MPLTDMEVIISLLLRPPHASHLLLQLYEFGAHTRKNRLLCKVHSPPAVSCRCCARAASRKWLTCRAVHTRQTQSRSEQIRLGRRALLCYSRQLLFGQEALQLGAVWAENRVSGVPQACSWLLAARRASSMQPNKALVAGCRDKS